LLPPRTLGNRATLNSSSLVDRGRPRPAVVWELWWCLGASCAVLVVVLALFWFAQPLADDFARGYKGRIQGVVPATVYEYHTWTGRWAGSGLSYFLTSSFDLVNAYAFLLLISPTLLAISVYAVLQAAAIGESIRQRLALTACLLALYWAGMPHPGDTFYWLTGGSDNLAGLALSLLLIAGLLRHLPRKKVTSWVTGGGLCLVAVLAAGFHELFALVLCILLAGSTLVLWLVNDGRRWLCICCLIAASAGFFVVYSAPGNRVRQADFPLASDPSTTLRLTVKQGLSNVIPWVLDVRLLSATALVLIIVPAAITAAPSRRKVNGREIAILAATWLCAIGAAFAAASWAIGMEIPARTRNGLYLIFLLGWFWLLVVLTRQLRGREPSLLTATPFMRRIAVGLFVASMLLTGNTLQGVRDLRGAAPAYRHALRNRWHALEAAAARGERDVLIEPLQGRPESYITYFEVREDPEYWENWSVAHYFGLRTVALRSKKDHD
jgi:Family of unknown function (DUF6056)